MDYYENSTYVSRFVRALTKNFRSSLNSDSIKIVGSNAIVIKPKLKNKTYFIFFCRMCIWKYILIISLWNTLIYLLNQFWGINEKVLYDSNAIPRRNRFVWVFNNADNDGTSFIHQQKYLPNADIWLVDPSNRSWL